MSKYFLGTYTVRILSDRLQSVSTPEDLSAALLECDSGDFVCMGVDGDATEVTPAHMAELLVQAGSEPGFFQLCSLSVIADSMTAPSDDRVSIPREAYDSLLSMAGRAETAKDTVQAIPDPAWLQKMNDARGDGLPIAECRAGMKAYFGIDKPDAFITVNNKRKVVLDLIAFDAWLEEKFPNYTGSLGACIRRKFGADAVEFCERFIRGV
jgi:hypothetical protein